MHHALGTSVEGGSSLAGIWDMTCDQYLIDLVAADLFTLLCMYSVDARVSVDVTLYTSLLRINNLSMAVVMHLILLIKAAV